MKIIRALSYILCFVIVFVGTTFYVSAHTTSQNGIIAQEYFSHYGLHFIGGETVGWGINESMHTNGSVIYYAFASGVTLTYKQKVYAGANFWSGNATITENGPNATGLISTINSSSNVITTTYIYTVNTYGHITSWEIELNTAKAVTPQCIAHEFGHILGLTDLFESRNINKLMYYDITSTATTATSSDIKGMQVITGSHTTHTWGYKYYTTNTYGQHVHAKYCTVCNGFHAASSSQPNVVDTGLCVYKNGICKICGNPENSTPW